MLNKKIFLERKEEIMNVDNAVAIHMQRFLLRKEEK